MRETQGAAAKSMKGRAVVPAAVSYVLGEQRQVFAATPNITKCAPDLLQKAVSHLSEPCRPTVRDWSITITLVPLY